MVRPDISKFITERNRLEQDIRELGALANRVANGHSFGVDGHSISTNRYSLSKEARQAILADIQAKEKLLAEELALHDAKITIAE